MTEILSKGMMMRLTESMHKRLAAEAQKLHIPMSTVARMYLIAAMDGNRRPAVGELQLTEIPHAAA